MISSDTLDQKILEKDRVRGTQPRVLMIGDVAVEVRVEKNISRLEEKWRDLEKRATNSVYQSFEWAKLCLGSIEKQKNIVPHILVGTSNGKTVFIFPMVLSGRLLKQLRWIGGKHVNLSMPLIDAEFEKHFTAANTMSFLREMVKQTAPLGFAKLCCQPTSWQGKDNIFATHGKQSGIYSVLSANLSDGFEGLLSKVNRKRKMKRFRNQSNFAERHGGFRLIQGETVKQKQKLIQEFLRQKSERFRSLGIKNVFAEPGGVDFLESIATSRPAESMEILQIYALEIGGDIKAVFGGGFYKNHFSGYFSSICNDEFAKAGPGEMLLHMVLQDLAERGVASIDLGCGNERYKRSWCTQSTELVDVLVPFNPLSSPVVNIALAVNAVKRVLRNNEKTWSFIQRLRKLKAKLPGA